MSEDEKDDNITLFYKDKKVKINTPETFSELEEIFLKKFNEDKNKDFRFYFFDSEEEMIDIDDSYYIDALDELKQQRDPIIKVVKDYNKDSFDDDKERIKNLNEEIRKLKNDLEKKSKIIEEQKEKILTLERLKNSIKIDLNLKLQLKEIELTF